MTLKRLVKCLLALLLCTSACSSATVNADGAESDEVSVSVLGADGPRMTQVSAAQQYGLNGYGVRVCVLDDSIDITHPTFGSCSEQPPWKWPCRVFYNYDASFPNQTAVTAPQVFHGTHVAGIAVGSQPFKLLDNNGKPLPSQRGVAYQARLGVFKIGDSGRGTETSSLYDIAILRAWNESVKAQCDVINMSFGTAGIIQPPESWVTAIQPVIDTDIIPVAAAGNAGGNSGEAYLWTLGAPSSIPGVISVAAVNNAETPVTTFILNRNVSLGGGENTNWIWAFSRADTEATTTRQLQLPVSLALLRTSPSLGTTGGCYPLVPITRMTAEQMRSKGLVMQIMPDCLDRGVQTDPNIWDWLLALRPRFVLIVSPNDDLALQGTTFLRNRQVPVFVLSAQHGAALAERLARHPSRSVRLMSMSGSFMMQLPRDWAGQPTTFSSMGPTLELGLKPDVSAPGAQMYSAAPQDRYHTLKGTSMASPYLAGVVALWKQRQRQLNIAKPTGGWIATARRALKNTARPIRYQNTTLMWPPVKAGAGLVRAMAAAYTEVSIDPPELLLRTDVAAQTLQLTLTNRGPSDIKYAIQHSPAVGVSLSKSWYRQTYDLDAPSAVVAVQPAAVIVPGNGKATVKVTIRLPDALRRLDNIVSGFITFTPSPNQPRASPIPAVPARQPNPYDPTTPDTARLSPLSVPYQGTSKDYSSFGLPNSLPLFTPPLPELNALAASLLQDRPPAYVCDTYQDDVTCRYTAGTALYRADMTSFGLFVDNIYIAVAVMRPAARLEVEIWCVPTARHNCTTPPPANSTDGGTGEVTGRSGQAASPQQKQQQRRQPDNSIASMAAASKRTAEQLQYDEELSAASLQSTGAAGAAASDVLKGTVDFGPLLPSLPLTYSLLSYNGYYYLNNNYTSDPVAPVIGATYRFRLRITPPLAQGDEAAGRKQAAVYMVDVAATATIIRRPPVDFGDTTG